MSTKPLSMDAKLKVEKSRANDWNNQLKESLRAPAKVVATAQAQASSLQPAPPAVGKKPYEALAVRRGPRR